MRGTRTEAAAACIDRSNAARARSHARIAGESDAGAGCAAHTAARANGDKSAATARSEGGAVRRTGDPHNDDTSDDGSVAVGENFSEHGWAAPAASTEGSAAQRSGLTRAC